MSDYDKLMKIADWFDARDARDGNACSDVQDDLRRIADTLKYWQSIAKWQRDEIIKKCDSFKAEDDEIERLRAEAAEKDAKIQRLESRGISDMQFELKEKDERIEEMEEALSKSIMHQKELDRCVHITAEQIDTAWTLTGPSAYGQYAEDVVRIFNIAACEECGGSKRVNDGDMDQPCPSCHGHGWVITSVDVDKYGRIGT